MINNEIEFIKNKPYYIFSIKNFLDDNLYIELKENFPNLDIKNFDKCNNGKYALDSKSEAYSMIIKNNSSMKKFHDLVFSKNFFNFFCKKLYFKYIYSQKDDIFKFLKYSRPYKQIINKKSSYDFFFSKISININYSFIKNNGFIIPHTDSLRKLLSLMIYFPNDDKVEKNYGTQFWSTKIKNYTNKHFDNNQNFSLLAKKLYKTPFIENTLFGFIRNNYSWHSVEPININKNYIRRSININFIYEN